MLIVDKWSRLAELLINLIARDTSNIDIDKMPDTAVKISMENKENPVEEE